MRLLIDGYNLLHATDLFGVGELEGTLRGSREALIDFLASRLSQAERRETVIVFDSAEAPEGLADSHSHDGIVIRFARDFPDADAMIESLLEGLHRARHLTVVSSDRRVQRAARSSGARWVDSGDWFQDLRQRPPATQQPPGSDRPRGGPHDKADWINEFSDQSALAEIEKQAAAAPPPKPRPQPDPATSRPTVNDPRPPASKPKRKKRRPPLSESGEKPTGGFAEGIQNPFPAGYADELLESGSDTDDRTDRTGDPGPE